jgi:hypothetical protein
MRIRDVFFTLIFVLGVGAMIYFGGRTQKLICTRAEPGGLVDCVRQTSWLWMIPMNEEAIRDVRAARSNPWWTPEEGILCSYYGIELSTSQGGVKLRFSDNLHLASSTYVEQRINDFLRGATKESLVINDICMFDEGFLVGIGLVVIIVGVLIMWRMIEYVFDLARPA